LQRGDWSVFDIRVCVCVQTKHHIYTGRLDLLFENRTKYFTRGIRRILSRDKINRPRSEKSRLVDEQLNKRYTLPIREQHAAHLYIII